MSLEMIRRLIKGYRVASLWDKALNKASQQEYAGALSCIRAIYEIFHAEIPSDRVPFDINILCGNVATKLGDYDLAVEATTCALRQIIVSKLSEYDKRYLRYYCRTILEHCVYKGREVLLPHDLSPFDIEFSSLDREKVRSDLVRNFPVTS
jgi:hypothetical protein